MRGTQRFPRSRQYDHRFIPACAGNTRLPWGIPGWRSVHPRVCGEHSKIRSNESSPAGSSPRVRGTRGRAQRDRARDGSSPRVRGTRLHRRGAGIDARFIPACAGNTGAQSLSRDSPRFIPACAGNTPDEPIWRDRLSVHPRVCGEHNNVVHVVGGAFGSSPRVRGTLQRHARLSVFPRFIPACAGNTSACFPSLPAMTVHPRVCGEHKWFFRDGSSATGSSPRVRGTPPHSPERPDHPRFIPACAGNTGCLWLESRDSPVHPRVCGEHGRPWNLTISSTGSSPRVRGTLIDVTSQRSRSRFIPACAGNTFPFPPCLQSPPVHPRVCGEHDYFASQGEPEDGSSPRVRGTQRIRYRSTRLRRFIPACAGNTAPKGDDEVPTAVHPRVCGEHTVQFVVKANSAGSSPRVRGTLAAG